MDGKPVTIRLLDPPLHEFLPVRVCQCWAAGGPFSLCLLGARLLLWSQMHAAACIVLVCWHLNPAPSLSPRLLTM